MFAPVASAQPPHGTTWRIVFAGTKTIGWKMLLGKRPKAGLADEQGNAARHERKRSSRPLRLEERRGLGYRAFAPRWNPVGMLQLKRGGHRQAQGQIENYYRRAGTRKASSDFTALVNSEVAARLPPRPLVALPRWLGNGHQQRVCTLVLRAEPGGNYLRSRPSDHRSHSHTICKE
jgi:hypothetical protein